MKSSKVIGIALLTMLMSVAISSCSKSDDNNNNNSSGSSSQDKHLVKWATNRSIEYDKLGRVTDYNDTKYIYDNNSITCGDVTFTLKNGRIISGTYKDGEIDFVYDNDGYLISLGSSSFTWSNGNLVSIEHTSGNKGIKKNISYTNIP